MGGRLAGGTIAALIFMTAVEAERASADEDVQDSPRVPVLRKPFAASALRDLIVQRGPKRVQITSPPAPEL